MATVTKTQYTPEDLLEIDDRPMPELVDGELLEREMGLRVDSIAVKVGCFLFDFIRPNRLGLLNGSQCGYQIFPDDPNKVRIPSVSFTRFDRLIGGKPAEGHARVAPDLVVELIWPNQTAEYVQKKMSDFLAAGVPLIWIVYPDTRTVFVQRLDGTGKRLQVGDFLDGEDILPGFRLEVASIFENPA